MADVVLVTTADRVRTITLNRPEARNALNTELHLASAAALMAADADPDVDAIVLTGADPAFCAGLDLRELGTSGRNLEGGDDADAGGPTNPIAALWHMTKPVIGAVNGPAVTGGLELALGCDLLVASERARFGDTHARVGVMPGGGMTGLLPAAIGLRRAKEMSFTGNFLDAQDAWRLGLVNHLVAHDDLVPFAQSLAADIAANDPRTVRALKRNYDAGSKLTLGECLALEQREFRAWVVSPEDIERRRAAVLERGRGQMP
jgi:enoyl-CoA hydratase